MFPHHQPYNAIFPLQPRILKKKQKRMLDIFLTSKQYHEFEYSFLFFFMKLAINFFFFSFKLKE